MQFAVAGFRYFNHKNKKSSMFIFLSFLFCILFIITIMITYINNNINYKNNYTNSRKIYYLSLFQSANNNQLKNLQSKCKSVGGAGYLYQDHSYTFVLAFGYLNKEDAISVHSKLYTNYDSVKIIERVLPELKSKIKKKVIANADFYEFFKIIFQLEQEYYSVAVDLEKSKINSVQAYNKLVKDKIFLNGNLSALLSKFNDKLQNNTIYSQIITIYQLIIDAVENCKDEIYRGELSSTHIKYLFIALCEYDFEIRNELNKI